MIGSGIPISHNSAPLPKLIVLSPVTAAVVTTCGLRSRFRGMKLPSLSCVCAIARMLRSGYAKVET